MKRLLILLFVLVNLSALGQTTVTADRIVAKSGFYLKDRWVDSIGVDTVMSGEIRSLPSSDAVYRMVAGRLASLQAALQFSLDDSTSVLRDSINALRADLASGGGGATSTTGLSDVSDAAPANNSTLVYNQDSAKYVPTQVAAYNLTSPQNGDLLKYQDGAWVNFAPTYGSGSSSYDSIAVTGTTDKAGFAFRPSDTALLVTYGGVTFSFKQGGGTASGSVTYETESTAFFTRVATAGGTLSSAHKDAINTYIKGLKDNGLYAKFTELWLFVGGNAAAHALGIKNAHNLAFTGTWLHAATGITGDGVTSYANTGVIPSAHMSLNDQHLSIWSRTNAALAGTTTDFGARNGAPNYEANVLTAGYGDPHYFATAQLGELPDPGNPQYTYATTQGWWLASRTSSANSVLYRNGSSVATGSLASSAQATVPLYLGAMNQSGTGPSVVSNREYAFASAGQGLSASEAATVYSLLNTLMTALGR